MSPSARSISSPVSRRHSHGVLRPTRRAASASFGITSILAPQAADSAPVLKPGHAHRGDVVGRYQTALNACGAEAIVNSFAPDGYFRESISPHCAHRGTAEPRSFFTMCFSAGGGIGLQHRTVTDDGVRCALEFNCVRWGSHDLPPRGRNRGLRTPPGRTAGRGQRLRRRRSTRRARPSAGVRWFSEQAAPLPGAETRG